MTDDWRTRAACLGVETDVFFPPIRRGAYYTRLDYAEALTYCARCPVRQPCLDIGVEHSLTDGVWGGTTPNDRRKVRKQRRALRVVGEPVVEVEHPAIVPLPASVSAGIGVDSDVHDLTEPESTVTRGELLRFRKAVPWTA